jgi:hypothetical protein
MAIANVALLRRCPTSAESVPHFTGILNRTTKYIDQRHLFKSYALRSLQFRARDNNSQYLCPRNGDVEPVLIEVFGVNYKIRRYVGALLLDMHRAVREQQPRSSRCGTSLRYRTLEQASLSWNWRT